MLQRNRERRIYIKILILQVIKNTWELDNLHDSPTHFRHAIRHSGRRVWPILIDPNLAVKLGQLLPKMY